MSGTPAYCPHCGALLAPGMRSCGSCGAAIAASAQPSGGFPWPAIVVGGCGVCVLVEVAIVVAVGYFVFLKPQAPATSPGAVPMRAPVAPPAKQPSPASGPASQPSAAASVSAEEALAKVRALPEVVTWQATVAAAGGSPRIDIDSEDAKAYTVHVYEMVEGEGDMPGHAATMAWYSVSKATGEVKSVVP